MDSLTELFCPIDEFCQGFEPKWEKRLLTDGQKKRRRLASLNLSELMTPAVPFYQLRYRQFKSFYFSDALRFLRAEFPDHRAVIVFDNVVEIFGAANRDHSFGLLV